MLPESGQGFGKGREPPFDAVLQQGVGQVSFEVISRDELRNPLCRVVGILEVDPGITLQRRPRGTR